MVWTGEEREKSLDWVRSVLHEIRREWKLWNKGSLDLPPPSWSLLPLVHSSQFLSFKEKFKSELKNLLRMPSTPALKLSRELPMLFYYRLYTLGLPLQGPIFLYHHLFMNLTVSFFFEPHRRHTRYYGGYHSNHRVVNWLWDVLEKEFSEEEKSRFLKVPYPTSTISTCL